MTTPSTGRINTFRRSVVAAIDEILPDLKSCDIQFGRFDIDALDKMIIKAPSVRVAVLNAGSIPEANDKKSAKLACAAFAITDGRNHEEAAWDIAEAIFTLLQPKQMFGMLSLSGASDARIQPIVTGDLKNRAVSIIAIEWNQELRHLGDGAFNDERNFVRPELYVNDEEVAE